MAEFDVKQVTNLEWAGIGAGVLAFVVSFFPWASIDVEGSVFAEAIGIDTSFSAWNAGFLAWFPVMLLIGVAVVVFLPHVGTDVPNRAMIWLVLSGLAVLFILLRWLTYESVLSVGFGLIVALILAIASGVAGLLVFRAAPKPDTTPQTGTAYGA